MSTVVTTPIRWPLADGRGLLFFSLPGHTPAPTTDLRPLTDHRAGQSQLRFDRQTGQWVIIAALRQGRTHLPAVDQCPLCPGPTGLTSEVPAPDYDVVVFENRFPSLAGQAASPLPPTDGDRLRHRAGQRPLRGRRVLQRPHRLVRRTRVAPRQARRRGVAAPHRRPDGQTGHRTGGLLRESRRGGRASRSATRTVRSTATPT